MHAQFDRLIDYVAEKLPAVADHLASAREEVLAFTGFPKDVWTQIWSNCEDLRRAVRAEQTDECAEGRRYLGLDVLARCRLTTVTTTNPEIGADDMPALTA